MHEDRDHCSLVLMITYKFGLCLGYLEIKILFFSILHLQCQVSVLGAERCSAIWGTHSDWRYGLRGRYTKIEWSAFQMSTVDSFSVSRWIFAVCRDGQLQLKVRVNFTRWLVVMNIKACWLRNSHFPRFYNRGSHVFPWEWCNADLAFWLVRGAEFCAFNSTSYS